MTETSEPESSVEELMSRMREGAMRRRILDGLAARSEPPAQTIKPIDDGNGNSRFVRFASSTNIAHAPPLALQPDFEPHAEDSYHARDLLKYHDRDFVQNAYRAILKRQPDATGFNQFIESLRAGQLNKIDVLAQLRYSPEGKAKNVRVDGLRRPAFVRSLYRLPVAGYLAQLIISLLRLPTMLRSQQQLESYLIAQQQLIADHFNEAHAQLITQQRLIADHFDDAHAQFITQQQLIADRFNDAHAQLAAATEALDYAQQQQQLAQDELTNQLITARQSLETNLAALSDRVELMSSSMESIFAQLSQHTDSLFTQLSLDVNGRLTQLNYDVDARFMQLSRDADTRLTELAQHVGFRFTELAQHSDLRFNELTEHSDLRFAELTQNSDLRFTQLGDHVEARFAETSAGLQHQKEAQRNRLEALAGDLKDETERILQKHQETRAELALQSRRISMLLEDAREQLTGAPDNVRLQTLAGEDAHTHDALYISLEDKLRGSRAEIIERLKIYLPLLESAQIGSEAMPLLDIGCGRGEWLEVLKAEGLNATGVDTNSIAIAQCRERGFDAREIDALAYLRALPFESVGAITCFHVAEHLPFDVLMKLLDEAVRVIKPGGTVVFETPNPQNVLVGSCNFYFDPTHRHPLPMSLLKFLIESRGFARVRVLNLHPSTAEPVRGDSELVTRFNELFYGPMDYAVIGWKAQA